MWAWNHVHGNHFANLVGRDRGSVSRNPGSLSGDPGRRPGRNQHNVARARIAGRSHKASLEDLPRSNGVRDQHSVPRQRRP